MHLHMSFFLCNFAAQNENKSIMGTLLGNNSKEQKTDKGNRLYTYINPMHYFIDAIRTVFIRGGGLHETAHQVLALAGIGTLMGCWAVQSYKKNS